MVNKIGPRTEPWDIPALCSIGSISEIESWFVADPALLSE